MEFQGFVKLDQHLVDNLGPYLEDKEAEFARALVSAIDKITPEEHPMPEPPEGGYKIKLFEAIEIFGKRIQQISFKNQTIQEKAWRNAADEINEASWQYLEFLEGSSSELFKQLNSVFLNQWTPELSQSVDAIKIMLTHHLEDFGWAIRRLEKQLWKLRWESERSLGHSVWFQKMISLGKTILDRSLFSHTDKTEKYLSFQYNKFTNRYGAYRDIYTQMEKTTNKLDDFEGLNSFESQEHYRYKKLYDFLKIWEINQKAKAVPPSEVAMTLNRLITPERAKKLFEEYYQLLSDKLFEYSRSLKSETRQPVSAAQKYSKETLSLAATIANYREFLLQNDPNPYVRSRWGFSEWISGPEPKNTKELLDLSYDVEGLKRRFDGLIENDCEPTVNFEKSKNEINRLLHGMSQPLISRDNTKSVAEKILEKVDGLDELGAINPSVVGLVAQTLSKLLKADWKYNVLFDIPKFHEIYSLHCALAGHSGDERQHINRLSKLKRMTQEILEWVKEGTTSKYTQEFELDQNDIKACLQDFLAYIQRIANDEKGNTERLQNWIAKMERELLEYRYLFGKFFHDLQLIEPDERLTRSKFLFVDRYFESIEIFLGDIKERSAEESQIPSEGEDAEDQGS